MRNNYQKNLLLFILLALYLITNSYSIPPHPDIIKKLKKEGRLRVLEQFAELKQKKGIDTPPKIKSPTTGERKVIVLLVDFADNPAKTPPEHYQNLLFSKNAYPTGSFRDYFYEVSYGKLDITGDVYLKWYRAPSNYSDYHNYRAGMGDYPKNAQKLTEDVINAADKDINFSQYDSNNDGYVDYLIVIHSGEAGEEKCYTHTPCSHIWSHMWELPHELTKDGVKIKYYAMCAENSRIGTFVHEFGHLLGLPDLYDTDKSSFGLGKYSPMATGAWLNEGKTPSHLDAWSKSYLNYITPQVVKENQSISIPQIETNPTCFKLWKGGIETKEYFLVENRQNVGFDKYLPSSGLLIYHIDEKILELGCITENNCNDYEWYPTMEKRCNPENPAQCNYLVAIEQADGRFDLEKGGNDGDDGDAYRTGVNIKFDYSTIPSSRSYANEDTEVSIENISASQAVMTADVKIKRLGELAITYEDLSKDYISLLDSYQNIPVLKLTFTAKYKQVIIKNIKVDKYGSINNEDITLKVYRDTGDDKFDPNTDIKIADAINFVFTMNERVIPAAKLTTFITIDINKDLQQKHTIKLELKDTTYIMVDEESKVRRENFPIQTKQINVLIGGLLTVRSKSLLPHNIDLSIQSKNIPALELIFKPDFDNVTIQQITVDKIGTLPSEDIIALKLFEDNTDGVFSLADTKLAEAIYSSPFTFMLNKQLNKNTTTTLFIVCDMNENIEKNYTFSLQLKDVTATGVNKEITINHSSTQPILSNIKPRELKIGRIYPLSTKDYIIFKYEVLSSYDKVILEVFNIRGDKVETRMDDDLTDDYIKLPIFNYSNNIYIYRLIVYNNNEKRTKVGKFFVLK